MKHLLEWAIQLNYYRILLEEAGFKVKDMVIQALCRDYSLRMAAEHNQTRVQNRTKGMETRTVYCDEFCINLLRKHKTYQAEWLRNRKIENPNQYIFLKRTVKKDRQPKAELPSRSSFHHFMRSFLKKIGLPSIDVHGFRRMAASYSVNNQVPLTTVQTMLGHKSLSTTMIYLRTLNASRKQGVEALSTTYQQLMDKKPADEPEDTE